MRKFLKPLSFLPAILLMYLIFSFSSQTGEESSALSLKVSAKIVRTADYVFDAGLEDWQVDTYAQKINFITRKLAHMTEYFALAIAVSFPLYVYGLHGILLMLIAGIVCVGFACGDEFHQSMVAGRSPSVRDVAIDSFGVFWGIVVVRIIGWTGRMTIFRPKKKKPKKSKQKNHYQESETYNQNYYKDNRPNGYAANSYGQAATPPYPQNNGYAQAPYGQTATPPYQQSNGYTQAPYGQAPYQQSNGYNGAYGPTPPPPYSQNGGYTGPPYPQNPGYSQNPQQLYHADTPSYEEPYAADDYQDHSEHEHSKKKPREKDWFFDL